ncbi:MAG: redoxin domain-containing protein [Clostridia bacterium]|nr:redoxin domain-containing protein [Clostridia bacterium]
MSRPRFLLLFTGLFAGLFGSCQRYEDLSAAAFLEKLGAGTDAQLVDVRTPEEYAAGHLPGALNIDVLADTFLDQARATLDPARPVMLYCRTGRRSADASGQLARAGFQVQNLLGGYEGWTGAGHPSLSSADDKLEAEYSGTLLKPGTTAPGFTLNDLEGKAVNLSDFRGKSVVLVFWASWCPDCRAEVPDLKRMAAEADPAKVQFVSVSFDREFDALVKFAAEQELPGIQLFDPAGKQESAVGAAFGVRWIPSLYLIDPEGKVVFGTILASKIEAALNAYPARLLAPGAVPAPAGESASDTERQPCEDESCAL